MTDSERERFIKYEKIILAYIDGISNISGLEYKIILADGMYKFMIETNFLALYGLIRPHGKFESVSKKKLKELYSHEFPQARDYYKSLFGCEIDETNPMQAPAI